MKLDNVLLFAEVYRKNEVTKYERYDTASRKMITNYTYPILLDDGKNVSTVNVPEALYGVLEERKKYVFTCGVNTDSQYASQHFTITGFLAGTPAIDGRENFVVVPESTLRQSNSKGQKTE